MKKWLLIIILLFSLSLITYSGLCDEADDEESLEEWTGEEEPLEEGDKWWHENCMLDCLEKNYDTQDCMNICD